MLANRGTQRLRLQEQQSKQRNGEKSSNGTVYIPSTKLTTHSDGPCQMVHNCGQLINNLPAYYARILSHQVSKKSKQSSKCRAALNVLRTGTTSKLRRIVWYEARTGGERVIDGSRWKRRKSTTGPHRIRHDWRS